MIISDLPYNLCRMSVYFGNFLPNTDNDTAIGGQMERAVVMNLTDEVQLPFVCIRWNLNVGFGLIRLRDDGLGGADLRLLPPMEEERIAYNVF